jgi:hypothetical protein
VTRLRARAGEPLVNCAIVNCGILRSIACHEGHSHNAQS